MKDIYPLHLNMRFLTPHLASNSKRSSIEKPKKYNEYSFDFSHSERFDFSQSECQNLASSGVTGISGFSLMEFVIVIVILGIVAVMPLFLWPGNVMNIDAQAKQFADDIRYTQSLSMAQSQRYRIVKSSAASYQILNSAGSPILFPNGSSTLILNSGLTFGTWNNLPNNLIAFDGRGTPYLDTGAPGTALTAGTTYSITITGSGNTKTITVTPLTGLVQVL